MGAQKTVAPFEVGVKRTHGLGKRAVAQDVHALDPECSSARKHFLGERVLRVRFEHTTVVESFGLWKHGVEHVLERRVEL